MTKDESKEVLEIYKLHADLADRVSQRRLGTNRVYAGALVGMMLFLGALLRVGDSNAYGRLVFCVIGIVGALLAVSWMLVIRSYKRLNDGKFDALLELERKLSYRFFEREWHFLGHQDQSDKNAEKTDRRKRGAKYFRLTVVEQSAPWLFFALYLAVVVWGWAHKS
ncbi:MAG: hypothetical protein OXG58_00975 [Gemmatimonadetes bacterium]|nr:hypothetical protein [Gemmatimonadota bacterium]MCY3942457.1 hypothetical protein [Gemmatimonadota bacterium]